MALRQLVMGHALTTQSGGVRWQAWETGVNVGLNGEGVGSHLGQKMVLDDRR